MKSEKNLKNIFRGKILVSCLVLVAITGCNLSSKINSSMPHCEKSVISLPSALPASTRLSLTRLSKDQTENQLVLLMTQYEDASSRSNSSIPVFDSAGKQKYSLLFLSLPDLKLKWRWVTDLFPAQVESTDALLFYARTDNGNIVCLEPEKSKVRWEKELRCSAFLLNQDKAYGTIDSTLTCIDTKTGAFLWALPIPDGPVEQMTVSGQTAYCLVNGSVISVDLVKKSVLKTTYLAGATSGLRSSSVPVEFLNTIGEYTYLALHNRKGSSMTGYMAVWKDSPDRLLWFREDSGFFYPQGITADTSRTYTAWCKRSSKPSNADLFTDLVSFRLNDGYTLWKSHQLGESVYYARQANFVFVIPRLYEEIPESFKTSLLDPTTGKELYVIDNTPYIKDKSGLDWTIYGVPNGVVYAGLNETGTSLSLDYWHL